MRYFILTFLVFVLFSCKEESSVFPCQVEPAFTPNAYAGYFPYEADQILELQSENGEQDTLEIVRAEFFQNALPGPCPDHTEGIDINIVPFSDQSALCDLNVSSTLDSDAPPRDLHITSSCVLDATFWNNEDFTGLIEGLSDQEIGGVFYPSVIRVFLKDPSAGGLQELFFARDIGLVEMTLNDIRWEVLF